MSQELQLRGDDGRLRGGRGLTAQQQALVDAFMACGQVTEAGRIAGVDSSTASTTLRLAHVRAAIFGAGQHAMAEMVPLALGVIRKIMNDPEAPGRLKLDAAKTMLDRVGLGPVKAGEGRQGDKRDLSDLSPAELAAFIQQGQERQRQARAVDTEGTVHAPGVEQIREEKVAMNLAKETI